MKIAKRHSMVIAIMIIACYLVTYVARGKGPTCPDVQAVDEFDLDRFLGIWYEMYRDHWTPYNLRECATLRLYRQE